MTIQFAGSHDLYPWLPLRSVDTSQNRGALDCENELLFNPLHSVEIPWRFRWPSSLEGPPLFALMVASATILLPEVTTLERNRYT